VLVGAGTGVDAAVGASSGSLVGVSAGGGGAVGGAAGLPPSGIDALGDASGSTVTPPRVEAPLEPHATSAMQRKAKRSTESVIGARVNTPL